jgi:hypothetical protein
VAEGMGPIVDRSQEHLCPADRAVVHLRRVLNAAADRLEAGDASAGFPDYWDLDFSQLHGADVTLPPGARWQEIPTIEHVGE